MLTVGPKMHLKWYNQKWTGVHVELQHNALRTPLAILADLIAIAHKQGQNIESMYSCKNLIYEGTITKQVSCDACKAIKTQTEWHAQEQILAREGKKRSWCSLRKHIMSSYLKYDEAHLALEFTINTAGQICVQKLEVLGNLTSNFNYQVKVAFFIWTFFFYYHKMFWLINDQWGKP